MSKRSQKPILQTEEQRRFAELCLAESYRVGSETDGSIGIYKEKRLHSILKHLMCDSESRHEVKVGRYVADVLSDGVIYEIQTKQLGNLRAKLEYYLSETEYEVVVIHPVIVRRTIIRADRESGEVKYRKCSPKHEDIHTALAHLYPIADLITHRRLTVRIMQVELEEYRFSEKVRHRRTGAYDSEIFPTSLVGTVSFTDADDMAAYFPENMREKEFSANDFAPYTKQRGRDLYSLLNTFAAVGILRKTKEKRLVTYRAK